MSKIIINLITLWILALVMALITKENVNICFCVMGVADILRISYQERR